MAEFYQPIQTETHDFTRYSRGFKGDTSVGEIFQGIGDSVKMGVEAADTYYQGSIKEEARQATDRLYNEYGNNAAVAQEAGINADVTPKEIQEGANQIQLLKQATRNGTLKESSFWAQAELISRQLKMRYPGHWEHVDQTMGSMLGRKPAQALQQELQREREATATQSDVDRRSALRAARSVGLTEVFVAEQQGKPFPTDEINRMVANKNAVKWQQEAASRTYSLKKARNEATKEDALLAQRTEATTAITSMLNDASTPLYKNAQEYRQYSQRLQRQQASGRGVDPQLQAQVQTLAGQLYQTVNDVQNQYMLKYASDVPMSELKGNIDFLDEWAQNYILGVQEGDLGPTTTNTAILKSTQDYNTLRFLQNNDTLALHNAFRNVMGNEAYTAWYTRNLDSKIVVDRDLAIEDTLSNKSFLQRSPVMENVRQMQQEGVTDPRVYNQHISKVSDATTADEMPEETKSNAIEALYGEKNTNFLHEVVPESQRVKMFQKLTAPEKMKKLRKLHDEGKISTEDFQKIVNWAGINAVQLIRDNAAEVNLANTTRKSITAWYDPETQLIKTSDVEFKPRAESFLGRAVETASENFQKGATRDAILRVDNILMNMKQVAEATGDDPKELIPMILQKAGIDVAPPAPEAVEPGTGQLVGLSGAQPYTQFVRENLTIDNLIKWLEEQKAKQEEDNGQ